MSDWRERISVNPNICHGTPCVKGTRIMVSVVLDNLAAGVKRDEIVDSYPGLEDADLDAALAYAAELAREGTVALPLESARDFQDRREFSFPCCSRHLQDSSSEPRQSG